MSVTTLTMPQQVLHDARAIADVCAASVFSSDPARVRAVLRTSPAAHSGSESVEGVFLDLATGEFVDRAGAPAALDGRPGIVCYEGTYEVLNVLSGPRQALSGQYSWTEPLTELGESVTARHIYDPFALPGVVTCRYDPGAPGAPFGEVRLLPEGWHEHAAEAELAPSVAHPAAAHRWLNGPNDLLFARALRSLTRAGQLDAALLGAVRARARGHRRAVVHYMTLAGAPRPAAIEALAADLASGSDPEHRRAAATGLLAARLFAPQAAVAAVAGWPPAMTPGGLLDPALTAGDEYVREAFRLLSPVGATP